ncbi:hypothetical protein [uncultured Aquimarina sp.]|uniref:hypothetical protein n=1 Tax=uncultured Aquimarina sp. TaxID=575652 RepID=UPI00260E2C56|nr:hypothetical protein [uncultured Aquimarina sp.]
MTTPSKEQQPQNQCQPQKQKLKYLKISSLIVFLIATVPFLFYINDIFPDGAIWENSFFTYQSKYYESVNVFVWVVLGKFIPLTLFIIWFFTCKHWWYPVILIPIALYSFQLISLILEDSQIVDENEIFYLIPLTVIILSVVYTIRTKIFDKIHGIDLSELNSFNKSDKKSWWNRFR